MNLVSRSRPCSSDAAKDTTYVLYRVHSLLYGKPFVVLHCKHFGHHVRMEVLTRRPGSSVPDSDTDMDEISLTKTRLAKGGRNSAAVGSRQGANDIPSSPFSCVRTLPKQDRQLTKKES
jgi:hypothetical protein